MTDDTLTVIARDGTLVVYERAQLIEDEHKRLTARVAALAPARECVYTEDGDGVWKCSACKWDVSDDLTESTWAYCPHCGARITESRAYVSEEDET